MVEESEQASPEGVDGEMLSATMPVKPFSPFIVMVATPVEPTLIDVGAAGVATIVKSTTFTVM